MTPASFESAVHHAHILARTQRQHEAAMIAAGWLDGLAVEAVQAARRERDARAMSQFLRIINREDEE